MGLKLESSYVQKVHDETQRVLSELKNQNERLRLQVAAVESERNRLQQDKLRLQGQLIATREELTGRNEEHAALMRRLTEVEIENQRVAAQFLDVETQNTNLANLYVASHQLRSSLKRADVVSVIEEIIVNLIGSEDFSIYEAVKGEERLVLIDSFAARGPHDVDEIRFGEGVIGSVAATGTPYIATGELASRSGITACIPLHIDGALLGVIAIFRLLPQKSNALEALDHELFDLLAAQAGVALYCSRLHEAAAR